MTDPKNRHVSPCIAVYRRVSPCIAVSGVFPRRVTMKSLKVELPFWVRVVLLAGVLCLVTGAGLVAYRYYEQPVTLTVAVGSLDGEAKQTASLIAGRLAT